MVRSVARLVVSVGLAFALLSVAAVATAWAAPPLNDTRQNATLIAALPFTDTVDTTEATSGPEDVAGAANCDSTPLAKSVWYRYTASSERAVLIDTSGSSFAVGGGVGTADSCVATFLGHGGFSAQVGQTYWIALGDVGGGAGGSLRLSVGEDVLPDTFVSGRAGLRGPSGCVKQAFRARVSGRSIASVTFFVDGKKIKTIRGARGMYAIKVHPARYGFGRHKIVARVEFTAASQTAPRNLPLTFRRCAQGSVAPRFTG